MPRRHGGFLAACGLVLVPFCRLGFGSDNDTYTMLDAGRLTWHFGLAATSRNPGYWAYEAMLFALAHVGGFALSNVASLVVGLIVVWRFLRIADALGMRFPRTLAAALVATPVFAIAATSSVDLVWSLAGVVIFAEMLVAEQWGWAVLAGAAAFALRGADGVVLAGAIAGAMLVQGSSRTRLLAVGVTAAMLGGLVYVASWRLAGHGFGFLQALRGDAGMWSARMWAGRFGYKTMYLFGPVAMAVLALAAVRPLTAEDAMHGAQSDGAYRRRAVPVFAGVVCANALLFLIWPIEMSYLLPAAFFGLLLLGISVLARRQWVAVAFLLAVVSLDVVTPRLVMPNAAGRASGAHFQPRLDLGLLVEDVRVRWALRECSDYDCYYRHFHGDDRGLHYEGPQLVKPSR